MDVEIIKNENEFCEYIECVKNKVGEYVYSSENGNHILNLPWILQDYKDWLIENKIVTENKK